MQYKVLRASIYRFDRLQYDLSRFYRENGHFLHFMHFKSILIYRNIWNITYYSLVELIVLKYQYIYIYGIYQCINRRIRLAKGLKQVNMLEQVAGIYGVISFHPHFTILFCLLAIIGRFLQKQFEGTFPPRHQLKKFRFYYTQHEHKRDLFEENHAVKYNDHQ